MAIFKDSARRPLDRGEVEDGEECSNDIVEASSYADWAELS